MPAISSIVSCRRVSASGRRRPLLHLLHPNRLHLHSGPPGPGSSLTVPGCHQRGVRPRRRLSSRMDGPPRTRRPRCCWRTCRRSTARSTARSHSDSWTTRCRHSCRHCRRRRRRCCCSRYGPRSRCCLWPNWSRSRRTLPPTWSSPWPIPGRPNSWSSWPRNFLRSPPTGPSSGSRWSSRSSPSWPRSWDCSSPRLCRRRTHRPPRRSASRSRSRDCTRSWRRRCRRAGGRGAAGVAPGRGVVVSRRSVRRRVRVIDRVGVMRRVIVIRRIVIPGAVDDRGPDRDSHHEHPGISRGVAVGHRGRGRAVDLHVGDVVHRRAGRNRVDHLGYRTGGHPGAAGRRRHEPDPVVAGVVLAADLDDLVGRVRGVVHRGAGDRLEHRRPS